MLRPGQKNSTSGSGTSDCWSSSWKDVVLVMPAAHALKRPQDNKSVLLPGGGPGPSSMPCLCHTSGVGKSVSQSLNDWVAFSVMMSSSPCTATRLFKIVVVSEDWLQKVGNSLAKLTELCLEMKQFSCEMPFSFGLNLLSQLDALQFISWLLDLFCCPL